MVNRAQRKRQRLELEPDCPSSASSEYVSRNRRRRRRVATLDNDDDENTIQIHTSNVAGQALAEGLSSIPNSGAESSQQEVEPIFPTRRRTRSSSRLERSAVRLDASREVSRATRRSQPIEQHIAVDQRRRRVAMDRFPVNQTRRSTRTRDQAQRTLVNQRSSDTLERHLPREHSWMSSGSDVTCIIEEDAAQENDRPQRSRDHGTNDEVSSQENQEETRVRVPPQPFSVHRSSIMDKIRSRLEKPMSLADGLDEFDNSEDNEECPVCMEVFDDREHARSQPLECKHTFCISCLLKWSGMTNTCPLCKRTYTAIRKFDCDTSEPVVIPVSLIEGEKSEDWSSDDELVGEETSSDEESSSSQPSISVTSMCVICEEEGSDTSHPSCPVGHRIHSACYRGSQTCPGCMMELRAPTFVTLGERLASVVMSNMRRRGIISRRRGRAAGTARAENSRRSRRRLYSVYYDA